MQLSINIQKKHIYFLSLLSIFLFGVLFARAYGSNDPSFHGHDTTELASGTLQGDFTFNGTVAIDDDLTVSGSTPGSAVYGDGSDGNVTISSSASITRDMFYDNLIITNNGDLNTSGYRVFVRGTLTNNGTIGRPGKDVGNTIATGGAALSPGTLGGSGAGGTGSTSATPLPGINGTSLNHSLGGSGGDGDSSYTSGDGGIASQASATPRMLPVALLMTDFPATDSIQGGAAGGGDGTRTGVGGGSGGGVVMIAAKKIINRGTITARGGSGGGSPGSCPVSAGAGGGGGGGVIVLVYSSLEGTGTISASGGFGASGVDPACTPTATIASNGAAGTIIRLRN